MSKLLEYGLSENIPNKTYHSDDFFTSSTAVKLLYYDIPKYEKEYIRKEKIIEGDKPAFTIGSLFHSMLLEPEMVESDYAFFPGWDGRESGYQDFKSRNLGKTVVTKSQKMQVDKMVENFKKHSAAMEKLAGGKNELTLCIDLFDIPVKVRFDHINIEEGYILDLKTSGFAVDLETFKMQGIGNLKYGISAGLYTLAAEEYFKKPFDFYFGCSSKKDYSTEIFRTGVATMSNGKIQSKIGLERLKYFRENGTWPVEVAKKTYNNSGYEIQDI